MPLPGESRAITGELNPAIRVTAEAEMYDPSPFFLRAIRLPRFDKVRENSPCYRRYGLIQRSNN